MDGHLIQLYTYFHNYVCEGCEGPTELAAGSIVPQLFEGPTELVAGSVIPQLCEGLTELVTGSIDLVHCQESTELVLSPAYLFIDQACLGIYNHFDDPEEEESNSSRSCFLDAVYSSFSPSSCGSAETLESFKLMCPLDDSYIVSGSCDHKGGVLTSHHGNIKVTIPEGAIEDGNMVIFDTATSLHGPFVLPSKCQTDLASPYYWIGVAKSYHFQKPVEVEFEHFAVVTACDPSHFKLFTCEDDDVSYIMRPVDCELRFKVRDDVSLCTFQTYHFCSYCLLKVCEDPMINRIYAYYLKPANFQCLDCFTVQVWFSFYIGLCLERNEELYTSEGMILDKDRSCIFEASCDNNSTSYFTLKYHQSNDGWSVCHFRFDMIQTQEINFCNFYTNMHDTNIRNIIIHDLKEKEKKSLFPPRFILNVRILSAIMT